MDAFATKNLLKIGEIALQSGLAVKTIRYYEDIDLLTPTVERSDAGYRLFSPLVLDRLAFIKRAQALGLSLSDIKAILKVRDQGQLPCDEVKQHIQDKVKHLSQQIDELQTLRSQLQTLLSDWQENPSAELAAQTICPNLQSLC